MTTVSTVNRKCTKYYGNTAYIESNLRLNYVYLFNRGPAHPIVVCNIDLYASVTCIILLFNLS